MKKKKKLSDKEIKSIIDKIKTQYDEYSVEHGESFFSKQNFHKRYMAAIASRMNLEAFAYSEIAFFEELKEKHAKDQELKRIKTEKPFTKQIENYIEELEKKWEKYPVLFPSSEISEEAQHLCGAFQVLFNDYWLNLSDFINKEKLKQLREYNTITDLIQKFLIHTKGRYPYEVESYVLNTKRFGIEKAHMLFLKEGANVLREVNQFLGKISQNSEEEDRIFNIITYSEQMISDFRFGNLI